MRILARLLVAIGWTYIGVGFFDTYGALGDLVGGRKYIVHVGAGGLAFAILGFAFASFLTGFLLLLSCVDRFKLDKGVKLLGMILGIAGALYLVGMSAHLPFVPVFTYPLFSTLLLAAAGCGFVTAALGAKESKARDG